MAWLPHREGDPPSALQHPQTHLPAERAGGWESQTRKSSPCLCQHRGAARALKTGLKRLGCTRLICRKPSARGRLHAGFSSLIPLVSSDTDTAIPARRGDLRGITDPQSCGVPGKAVFSNQILHKPVFKNNPSANPSAGLEGGEAPSPRTFSRSRCPSRRCRPRRRAEAGLAAGTQCPWAVRSLRRLRCM